MTNPLRETVKRLAPDGARQFYRRMVARPDIDAVVLKPYRHARDPSPAPRLNLLIPGLEKGTAFGGVLTGIRLVLEIFADLRRDLPALDLRFVAEDAPRGPSVLESFAGIPDDGTASTLHLREAGWTLPLRDRDLFICFNWWTALNLEPCLDAQAAAAGQPRLPRLSLIQDYEPGFYPFSAAHLYARQAFTEAQGAAVWGIFNAQELHDYYELLGHNLSRHFVLEPQMEPRMLAQWRLRQGAPKARTLLVYGRPQVPRNCFALTLEALRLLAARPESRGWQFQSIGEPHDAIPLGSGADLVSIGKLDLAAYADLLAGAAVGLSLMASPHPSYPPLEMAHFGMQVVTNSFTAKNLATRHANIVSVPEGRPAALADALADALAAFDSGVAPGWAAPSHMPHFLSDAELPVAAQIAAAVRPLLQRPAPRP